ncbi:MAG TPA: hypothetical protein VGA32_05515 [Anaerolineales bacterium]
MNFDGSRLCQAMVRTRRARRVGSLASVMYGSRIANRPQAFNAERTHRARSWRNWEVWAAHGSMSRGKKLNVNWSGAYILPSSPSLTDRSISSARRRLACAVIHVSEG